jgi:hypothetical protein
MKFSEENLTNTSHTSFRKMDGNLKLSYDIILYRTEYFKFELLSDVKLHYVFCVVLFLLSYTFNFMFYNAVKDVSLTDE